MKLHEVWSEGFAATGQSGTATCYGRFPGETFRDAVIAWRTTLGNDAEFVELERLSFWCCRLFDNEAQARESFG